MVGHAAVFDIGVGDAGADLKVVARIGHRGELGDRGDVDQQIRLGEAKVQHRAERLAARQDLGEAAALAEQIGGVGERDGPLVVERDGLHGDATAGAKLFSRDSVSARFALASAARMRRGVIGISQISTPS